MSKAKPCPRLFGAGTEPCGRPKMKGKQSCVWHWLLRQSSDVQASYAKARLTSPERDSEICRGPGGEPRMRVPEREWPNGERWCSGCQHFVPLFYVTGSRCKACASMASHAGRLEKTYGIDAAEYDRIFQLQGGRCAICRNKPASKRFAVDHDHKTGEVRGILCKRCNHDLLGGAHDGVLLMWRAIGYLLFPPAQRAVVAGVTLAPTPGEVVAALRDHLAAMVLRDQPKLPPTEVPPF